LPRIYELDIASSASSPIEVEALDGDPRRVEVADPTPDDGLPLDGAYVFTSGRAVVPDFMPRLIHWGGPRDEPIPDFEESLILSVSGRARGLIEALEPCLHQFLPVVFVGEKQRRLEERYFLIVRKRIDSVDRQRTTMLLWHGIVWEPARLLPPDEIPAGFDASVAPHLVFNLHQIGRSHLWRDKHLKQGPFLSEALATALRESGMTGLSFEGSGFEAV
jgi:hypothetical protein